MVYVNGVPFGDQKFPNNETNYKKVELQKFNNKIAVFYESNEDLYNIILAKKYIDEETCSMVDLFIPYFPYSRMDREMSDQLFTLDYVVDIINKLAFKSVTFFDGHSPVTLQKVIAGIEIPLIDFIQYTTLLNGKTIFFPDKGAAEKYIPMFSKVYPLSDYIIGNKKRDPNTGKIISYEIIDGEKIIKERSLLIIDDICSFGGTFIMAAEKIQEFKPHSIELFISHCENSIFNGKLIESDLINKIYTTNSILRPKNDKIFTFNIFKKEGFYEEPSTYFN